MDLSILESIDEAICVLDLQRNLIYANRAFERATGWPAKAILGGKCFDFLGTPEDCAGNCPLQKILSGETSKPCKFEKTIRTRSGEIKYMQVSAAPLYERGKPVASTVMMQDITRLCKFEDLSVITELQLREEFNRRKKLEESLRRSEAMYRAMFEHTGTAMLVINEDRTIAMANQEVERLTGYSRDQLVGKRKWDEFVHPEDREWMMRYHMERRKEGSPVPSHYEFRLIHAGGKILDIFYTIGMIPGSKQSVGSMLDITERKQMERALRESEEKYRLLLENIEDVFYEVDFKGNFTFVNDSVQRVFGFDRRDLIGRNYRELVDQENARKVFAAYNKVFATGVPERGFSWTITRPDGQKRELEVSVSPIRDRYGKITGFRGTARDITERKQVEERLRYLSLHDALTGLYNRAYFEEEVKRLETGRHYPVSFICGDVDGLKQVNDTLGHKKGDELLVAAARVLKSAIRESDVVARVGGDEFVVILPGTGEAAAENVCRRIKETIAGHNRQNPELPLNISLGWATAENKNEFADLYKRADDNMYREKMRKKCYHKHEFKMSGSPETLS
ncbi:PAS domain S-box protein [Desulfallas sp. Bu1-1]|uniref:sensor domain-containing diguanylate cyclase n=1 Tax=Desulfallas sp. Bu1-1 TaxID=2787620 RepID=UPI00189F2942|nr:sensor domain-containing diguanylate cyclase [Desulfallas sp. Bu1-1]MBF7083739.1 PAS domain S-box protein [Desulfallas sp. Bu1-1]